MNKIRKCVVSVFSFLLSFLISIVTSNFLSTLYAKLYALNEGVSLKELSEDYFMGFTSFLVFVLFFLFLLPVLYFLIKKQINKRGFTL